MCRVFEACNKFLLSKAPPLFCRQTICLQDTTKFYTKHILSINTNQNNDVKKKKNAYYGPVIMNTFIMTKVRCLMINRMRVIVHVRK